jgi:hypothetical protein
MEGKVVPLRSFLVFFAVLALACAAFGAEGIGTVTGSGPFKLRGEQVPATAVQGLTVASGDEVETIGHEAVILLSDKSRLGLGDACKVKVLRQDAGTFVGLAQGGIQFRVPLDATMKVCALSRLIVPFPGSEGTITITGPDEVNAVAAVGTVRVDDSQACNYDGTFAKWLTKKKAVVIVIAGAAAGTAAGIAISRRGAEPAPPPVSPSKP